MPKKSPIEKYTGTDNTTSPEVQEPGPEKSTSNMLGADESSCQECDAEDNQEMVQCDNCQRWSHFTCAAVTQEIENLDWCCRKCTKSMLEKLKHPEKQDTHSPENSKTTSSRRSNVFKMKHMLQQLEEEEKLRQEEEQAAAAARAKRREFLAKKKQLLENIVKSESGESEVSFTGKHSSSVTDWLNKTIQNGDPKNPAASLLGDEQISPSGENTEDGLTKCQIAARQAVSKELPPFSGSPEEWPMFYATFISTTEMCGYSASENMVRLQRCLRGKALEAVRSRLLHPRNVNGVIDTLKMLFGRPEVIIQTLIAKVQAMPAPRADKLSTLVDYGIAVSNLTATIEACQLNEYLHNVSLLNELVDKLPSMVKLNWATHRRCLSNVNLSAFSAWLYTLVEAASSVSLVPVGANDLPSQHRNKRNDGFVYTNLKNVHPNHDREGEFSHSDRLCFICKGTCPSLEQCAKFNGFTVDSRWAAVREGGLCRRCLRNHIGLCHLRKECGINNCAYKHHTLLHSDKKKDVVNQQVENSNTGNNHMEQCNSHRGKVDNVMFRILPVTLYSPTSNIKTFALFDDGSSLTLMDEELAKNLQLHGELHPLWLKWTGDTCRYEETSYIVEFEVSGVGASSKRYRMHNVHTVKGLKLPSQTLDFDKLAHKHTHLRGLPIESFKNARPRLLIGMNNCRLGNALNSKEGRQGPVASKTRLGWVVFGNCDEDVSIDQTQQGYHSLHVSLCGQPDETDLHRLMKDYFSLEGIGITKSKNPLLSSSDQRSLSLLREHTRRVGNRYETALLWRYDDVRLPDSKNAAMQRLNCLEKRMRKNAFLAEMMHKKIQEYLQKGYIRKLDPEEINCVNPRIWYLPIFPVFNPNKPGKLRVVWDAAATVQGISLNSMLLTGPDQITSLVSVLFQFRERRVAVGGDVREMFHQVLVREEDRNSQRFLWRDKEGETPNVFVMNVMTFGASCSPSCAQFVKNQNALEFSDRYPEAASAIIKGHYVDDLLISVETPEEAIRIAQQIQLIHKQAGFEMHHWISNSSKVLSELQETNCTSKDLNMGASGTAKVLGMWWDTSSDTITYKISTNCNQELLTGVRPPTKREMLKVLMKFGEQILDGTSKYWRLNKTNGIVG
ncbi:uncharacterized protein LOC131433795 [Malaya genurostris]|uniref:uncharacterized protein LOC131433795 n=1 Tax=Malaya genurostris TaxID=325434 RepID=UPI0026F38627|nr:uncharacterized protein LOC131433795 [Malaya genurostris]